MVYAEGTSVTVESSQQEIGRTLSRYRVEEYAFGAERGRALVMFKLGDLPIRVAVPLPERPPAGATERAGNGRRVPLEKKWDQQVREAWRALALMIKANLEACERNIVSPQQAFMAYLVTGNGQTVGDVILPQYEQALAQGGGKLALMPGSG